MSFRFFEQSAQELHLDGNRSGERSPFSSSMRARTRHSFRGPSSHESNGGVKPCFGRLIRSAGKSSESIRRAGCLPWPVSGLKRFSMGTVKPHLVSSWSRVCSSQFQTPSHTGAICFYHQVVGKIGCQVHSARPIQRIGNIANLFGGFRKQIAR